MLRITQQSHAAGAKSYYSQPDYYSEGQELTGRWGGLGAARLGLEGSIDQKRFHQLCDNINPLTGENLTPRTRGNRTVGYDFTFNAPKSVSVLYALTKDHRILDAWAASVQETMQEAEKEMQTRVREIGKDENRVTGNMIWGEFVHLTSRPVNELPDPHLHSHIFVFNATHDAVEGRWKAGQFRDLKRDARYFEAAFHSRLSKRMVDLGFGVERTRTGWEITGVPKETLKRFSRRTQQIEKLAQEKEITDPKEREKLGAKTREHKQKDLAFDQLRKLWTQQLSEKERSALNAVVQNDIALPERLDAAPERAVEWAIDHSFANDSVISEKKLLEAALRHGVGATTIESAKQEFRKQGVIQKEWEGQRLVTTTKVLEEERQMIDFAQKGRGTREALGTPNRKLKREWLNDSQSRVVNHVLSSMDRVILIRGIAGTGKTTLMQEAIEGIREGGHQVVVLAPGAEAARSVLRKEVSAEADTVSKFLLDREWQLRSKGQVIWVDEAGLLSTKQMKALFDTANKLDARVILSGDTSQHRSVERGDALRVLEDLAGLPVAEVVEIQRQKGLYKQAVQLLSSGKTLEGLKILDDLGWVKELPDEERQKQLTGAYVQTIKQGKSALVVSPTHAEAAGVTASIRDQLKKLGSIRGGEHLFSTWRAAYLTEAQQRDPLSYQEGEMLQFHQNVKGIRAGTRIILDGSRPLPVEQAQAFNVFRPSAIALAKGDTIRITAGGLTKDRKHHLDNGMMYRVKAFTDKGDIVLNNGWIVDKDFGHIAHGYVVTSWASQGKTVDRVFISQSSESFAASSKEQIYVSASRAREELTLFTSNKSELRAAIQRSERRMSASELVKPKTNVFWMTPVRKHFSLLRRLRMLQERSTKQLQAKRYFEPTRDRHYERDA